MMNIEDSAQQPPQDPKDVLIQHLAEELAVLRNRLKASEPAAPCSARQKGDLGEDHVREFIQKAYPDAACDCTARVGKAGDLWVTLHDQKSDAGVSIMLEVKFHKSTVSRDAVDRFRSDAVACSQDTDAAVLLSLSSNICGRSDFHIETLDTESGPYDLIYIEHVNDDPNKIKLVLEFVKSRVKQSRRCSQSKTGMDDAVRRMVHGLKSSIRDEVVTTQKGIHNAIKEMLKRVDGLVEEVTQDLLE